MSKTAWRTADWTPATFTPNAFLSWFRNNHLTFVSDSLARKQVESLLCLLASRSPSELMYRDDEEIRFRRWAFREHNATMCIF
ncbi:hypothetical protein E2562_019261 [Oryza meyeriana var. granulata]|uniref:Trichome birefringence-like C-terminal domain-containing protein n=1 Tax=Oryza meyeriana var. granulata TaxID=110450 RepID=A0A6G1FAF3_9ORYZ|nr:hypothetical protein E2562_019261 [Oryza meyeriana var. granulata]